MHMVQQKKDMHGMRPSELQRQMHLEVLKLSQFSILHAACDLIPISISFQIDIVIFYA